MSALAQLRTMPEARKGALAPLRQVGLINGARAVTKALIRSRLDRNELPRQFLLSFWDTLGSREALIFEGQRITFSQFKDRVLRFADVLHGLGLKTGDRFAELLYNSPVWFEAMAGGTLTGIHMPMLNWHLRPHELAQCINAAQPQVLLVDHEFLDRILPIRDQIPSVKHYIVVGGEPPEGMHSYEALMARAQPVLPPGKLDMAPRPYSGGTTGTPKYMNINRERLASVSDEDWRGGRRRRGPPRPTPRSCPHRTRPSRPPGA